MVWAVFHCLCFFLSSFASAGPTPCAATTSNFNCCQPPWPIGKCPCLVYRRQYGPTSLWQFAQARYVKYRVQGPAGLSGQTAPYMASLAKTTHPKAHEKWQPREQYPARPQRKAGGGLGGLQGGGKGVGAAAQGAAGGTGCWAEQVLCWVVLGWAAGKKGACMLECAHAVPILCLYGRFWQDLPAGGHSGQGCDTHGQ